MQITFVSIFPDVFNSFVKTSLIHKAQDAGILNFAYINPRDFCQDKHRQVDDAIYGGGAGLLMKAKPIIDSVESVIESYKLPRTYNKGYKITWKVIYVSPSEKIFNQNMAHMFSELEHIIFVSGRYEGIDYRFVQYMQKMYPDYFDIVSLGQFITLGGEVPAMVMTESIVRLITGVIKEEASWQDESYSLEKNMKNLEYPQYTRPEVVRGMTVPEVLLSGNHAEIEKWRNRKELTIDNINE